MVTNAYEERRLKTIAEIKKQFGENGQGGWTPETYKKSTAPASVTNRPDTNTLYHSSVPQLRGARISVGEGCSWNRGFKYE